MLGHVDLASVTGPLSSVFPSFLEDRWETVYTCILTPGEQKKWLNKI